MNDSTFFFGLGRSWAAIFLVVIGVTVALIMKAIDADFWWEVVKWALAFGVGKSAVVGAAGKIGGNK